MLNRTLKLFFAAALGVIALSACGEHEPETPQGEPVELLLKDQTLKSVHMNMTMKYSVWLPEGLNPTREFPVLYLLHGLGDDNNSWLDKGGAVAIIRKYIESGGEPMVVVMPNAFATFYTDGLMGDFESYFHKELIPYVEKTYKCNGKSAVAGLSMGGYGTLYNVLNHPDKFTYGYAMSPATSVPGFEDLYALASGIKKPSSLPPLTLESGSGDYVVTFSSVQAFSEHLTKCGIANELIERPGGHDWAFWPVCLEKALVKIGDSFK